VITIKIAHINLEKDVKLKKINALKTEHSVLLKINVVQVNVVPIMVNIREIDVTLDEYILHKL